MKSPQDGIRHAQLGFLYALMGRKDEALREGQRGEELTPVSKDTITEAQSRVSRVDLCAQRRC